MLSMLIRKRKIAQSVFWAVFISILLAGLHPRLPLIGAEITQAKSPAERLQEIRNRKKRLESKLNQLKEQKISVTAEINRLDRQMDDLSNDISRLESELAEGYAQLKSIRERLDEITAEINYKKQRIKERVIAVYMQGELTYLDIIFNASSLRDFMNRIFYLNLIFEKDKQMVDELEKKKTEKRIHLQNLSLKLDEISRKRDELNSKKAKLNQLVREKRILLSRISQNAQLTERQLKELEEESKRIEEEIRRLQGAYKGPAWTGKFVRPVEGRITSYFGRRFHPIIKKWKNHDGLDIAAPHGTPVKAGGDGRVIYTGWRGGYGKTIIIDHGNRVTTLYAHLSRIAVSTGTVVKAGQVIGYVGSTGYSTGPHLHFEVRKNGKPVNPLGKL